METSATNFIEGPLTPEVVARFFLYGAAYGAGFWAAGEAFRAGKNLASLLKDKIKELR